LVEETGVPGKNHWQTLSHNVVSSHNIRYYDENWVFHVNINMVQYTPSVSTIKLSGPTYSSQNVRHLSTNVRQIWESTLSKSDWLWGAPMHRTTVVPERDKYWPWSYLSWREYAISRKKFS
jgi:hypothetical protein